MKTDGTDQVLYLDGLSGNYDLDCFSDGSIVFSRWDYRPLMNKLTCDNFSLWRMNTDDEPSVRGHMRRERPRPALRLSSSFAETTTISGTSFRGIVLTIRKKLSERLRHSGQHSPKPVLG